MELVRMESAELSVLALNFVIISMTYLSIYPKVAGDNLKKIAVLDILLSSFALLVVGLTYWGINYEFNLLTYRTNWFWFTLTSYLIIEIPFMLWYIKKYKINL
jgi:hypothetical protein